MITLGPARRRRHAIVASAALSVLGAGSVLIHHFTLSKPKAASVGVNQIAIERAAPSGETMAAVAPRLPDRLFLSQGKQDRADYAASRMAAEPGERDEPGTPFISASLTPVDMAALGASPRPGFPRQTINRGGKTDRLSAPQISVSKLLAEDEARMSGVSAALFMIAPSATAGPGSVFADAPADAADAADASEAARSGPRPSPEISWSDLIQLARIDGGDGESIKPSIFGGLTEKQFRAREFRCMATAVYFEARGEPLKGQIAVGQVIMTRVNSDYYPNTICGVVYQGQWNRNACQFSFACDGKPDTPTNKEQWQAAIDVAKKVIAGKVYLKEIGDATHYHADYVSPPWRKLVKRVAKIGVHIFYKAPFVEPLYASNDPEKL